MCVLHNEIISGCQGIQVVCTLLTLSLLSIPSFCRACLNTVFMLYIGHSFLIMMPFFISPAASSFSFCRPAVEYRALPEDFKYQLSRRTGGNLTWHDGRGQKTAGGRTVKLLQQPGTEPFQVLNTQMTYWSDHLLRGLMWCDSLQGFIFTHKSTASYSRFYIVNKFIKREVVMQGAGLSVGSNYITALC